MIALSFWASWALIGLTVAGLILFYAVIDLAADQFVQWRDADPWVEDLTSHEERER